MNTNVNAPVLHPGTSAYDEERAGFQTAARHRPALVVRASGPGDVQTAVAYAHECGLPVAVQAAGHGISLAAEDGDGVLISTRAMDGVRIDPARRTAHIAAGARWEQVIAAAAEHGLAPLSGSSPGVGAVPYTLGGGLGLLAREYGYAADHVRGIDVVTADGRLRRAAADSETDLFWALRGARDNFGVVTGMDIGLVPVSRLFGGALVFVDEHVEPALEAYLEWTSAVPEELTSSVGVMRFPDLPAVPEPLRGRYTARIRIAFTGPAADAERLVEPLRAAGPPLADELRTLPFGEGHTIHKDPAEPHAYAGDGLMLHGLDAATLLEVARLTGPDAPAMTIVQLNHLGGALARPPADGSAVGHRDTAYLLRTVSPLDGTDPGTVRALHSRVARTVAPVTAGRSLNFLFGPHTADAETVRSAYEPDAYHRLTELKAAYDPANTFRLNHNIPPAPGT